MSVLIKGIELPNNCYECPFAMEYYSTIYMKRGNKFRADYSCVITHKTLTSTKRNRFCPLVEIPPHGDLIDRDALSVMSWKEDEVEDSFGAGAMFVLERVDELPTVIEAEECET